MLLDSGKRVIKEFKIDADVNIPFLRFVHPRRQIYLKYLFENLGPSIDQVWVFGSAVTPDHYSWSDLDMLLLGDISDEDLLRIYGGFSEARKLDTWNTNKNVDIVCDTLSNFERDKDEFGHVLWYVNRYGVLYYDRRWDNE